MRPRKIKDIRTLWLLAFSVTMLSYFCCTVAYAKENDVYKTAQQYISEFRDGKDFDANRSTSGLSRSQYFGRHSLFILTKELATGTSQVRENIVKLMERVGLELDSPSPDKFPVIRNRAIIKALLIEGFARDDTASDAAAAILREQCLPSDLAAFSGIYLKSLQAQKGEYLYLVAKAKVIAARPYVDVLARSEKWQRHEETRRVVKIVQAALGNTEIEDGFIEAVAEAERNAPPAPANRFYDVGSARDGKQIAASLATLGLIGTRRSLLTVCAYLRSPMKTYVPNHRERSIRYDALDALRYNYPDERLLYRPTTLDEWTAAEAFCTRTVGAVFDGPTPDIPPDHVYPAGVSPRPLRR